MSPLKRDRRTKSFSAKAHTRLTNGTSPSSPSSPSHSYATGNSPMARANSTRRSKTPTSLTSSIRSTYGVERAGNGSGQAADRTQGRLVRTGSQGHMGKFNAKLTPPAQQQDKVSSKWMVNNPGMCFVFAVFLLCRVILLWAPKMGMLVCQFY